MSPAAPLARTDNLTAMLRLVGLFRRTFADLLAREPWVVSSGVKPSTYGLLSVVDRRQPVSQREVCDALGTHASDMVDIVDGAERQGWVERRRDPSDRRRYQLTITPDGRHALARYDELAALAEAEVLAPLSEAERRHLVALVTKVVDRST
ncbi:MAG: MarR family winged helix-turn-helix transcriptional regulator [Actinomycetes bacterium]|jgi:DNA-binding MarR family transcriptional regulator